MKRKPPKPKSPKSPKTVPPGKVDLRFILGWPQRRGAALGLPGFAPAPTQARGRGDLLSVPSPEWLVETACRLAAGSRKQKVGEFSLFELFYTTGAAGENFRKTLLELAYLFHQDAKHAVYIHTGGTPLPAFFSPHEIKTKAVDYVRGCLLITGLTKPKQAVQKFEEVQKNLPKNICWPDSANRPKQFFPQGILLAMCAYEDFSKKPLDLEKSQYAPHPGHNAKPARRKRKRRGPRLPKLGQ